MSLVCKKTIFVHRAIIMLRSTFMKAMQKSSMQNGDPVKIEKNAKCNIDYVLDIILFIYIAYQELLRVYQELLIT